MCTCKSSGNVKNDNELSIYVKFKRQKLPLNEGHERLTSLRIICYAYRTIGCNKQCGRISGVLCTKQNICAGANGRFKTMTRRDIPKSNGQSVTRFCLIHAVYSLFLLFISKKAWQNYTRYKLTCKNILMKRDVVSKIFNR